MAEKRMFAKTIIDSDAFLDMPVTARLLYYDLAMRADDDGFVNSPKRIMRTVGASQDDLSILIMRKFIIPFASGVVVIKHWRIHNYIRKDTYKETPYVEEKAMLDLDKNNSYTLKSGALEIAVDEPLRNCDGLVTDSSQNRHVDKNRLDKSRLDQNKLDNAQIESEFVKLWQLYPNKKGRRDALKHYTKARRNGTTYEEVESGIRAYADYIHANKAEKYTKYGSTFFSQKAWEDDWSCGGVNTELPDDGLDNIF